MSDITNEEIIRLKRIYFKCKRTRVFDEMSIDDMVRLSIYLEESASTLKKFSNLESMRSWCLYESGILKRMIDNRCLRDF